MMQERQPSNTPTPAESSIRPGMRVTVEEASGLRHQVGKAAIVLAVIRCFVVLRIGDDVRGCLATGVQPIVTEATFGESASC